MIISSVFPQLKIPNKYLKIRTNVKNLDPLENAYLKCRYNPHKIDRRFSTINP
jgi:hypothetical protein